MLKAAYHDGLAALCRRRLGLSKSEKTFSAFRFSGFGSKQLSLCNPRRVRTAKVRSQNGTEQKVLRKRRKCWKKRKAVMNRQCIVLSMKICQEPTVLGNGMLAEKKIRANTQRVAWRAAADRQKLPSRLSPESSKPRRGSRSRTCRLVAALRASRSCWLASVIDTRYQPKTIQKRKKLAWALLPRATEGD
jgi:hypothetical protein